ncbi:hypothetical protein ACFSHQ_00755 [Gemmobacter lanyuensis]
MDAISITTHGACAALLDHAGALAAPVMDYEDPRPGQSAAYAALRPPFAETGAPQMAMGLNLGAQLHWQLTEMPDLRDRVAQVVTYPQFWAHRLSGVAATDVTSLGCHTDLWNPWAGQFSTLPARLGLPIAPARPSGMFWGRSCPRLRPSPACAPIRRSFAVSMTAMPRFCRICGRAAGRFRSSPPEPGSW